MNENTPNMENVNDTVGSSGTTPIKNPAAATATYSKVDPIGFKGKVNVSKVAVDPAPLEPIDPPKPRKSVRVSLQKPTQGHFTALLPLWGEFGDLLATSEGKGAVARLHKRLSASHALYKVESWGEWLPNGVLEFFEVDKDPFGQFLLHPDWSTCPVQQYPTNDSLEATFRDMVITADSEVLYYESHTLDTACKSGIVADAVFTSPSFVANVRLTIGWRGVTATFEMTLQRRAFPNSTAICTVSLPKGLLFSSDNSRELDIILNPYIGTISFLEKSIVVEASTQRTDIETTRDIYNSGYTFLALPQTWKDHFLGSPVVYSTGQETDNLKPRLYPNAPGADACFGITSTSLIWKPFPLFEGVWKVREAADAFLKQPSHWLETNSHLPVDPDTTKHPKLSLHKMHPWTNVSQAKDMDGLGILKPGDYVNPTPEGIWNFDHEHRAVAPLATAYVLTGRLAYELAIKFRAHAEIYERSTINGWVQNGRGEGRPLATLAVMAAASSYCHALLGPYAALKVSKIRARQKARFPNIDAPVIVATTFNQNNVTKFTGYEEGLLAQAGLLCFWQWGNQEALELAWVSGRTATTTVRKSGNTWIAAYQIESLSDGTPVDDSKIFPGNPWLQRWTLSGLKAFLFATLEYKNLNMNMPTDVGTEQLLDRAQKAVIWYDSFLPTPSPTETTTYIHQGMYSPTIADPI